MHNDHVPNGSNPAAGTGNGAHPPVETAGNGAGHAAVAAAPTAPAAPIPMADPWAPSAVAPMAPQAMVPAGSGGVNPAAAVMEQYHHLMAHFLATERAVMMGFFGQPVADQATMTPSPMPVSYAPVQPQPMPAPVAAVPMAPAPSAPAPSAPMAVPPAPAVQSQPAVAPVAEPAPAAVAAPAPAPVQAEAPAEPAPGPTTATKSVADELLAVVADRTGYPPEMLNLDAEMEADLGIDSIKRVEIAGAMLEILDLSEDDIDQEELIGARSLREAISVLEGASGGGASGPFQ